MTDYNKDLCDNKHQNISEKLDGIIQTLCGINSRLERQEEKYVTKSEVRAVQYILGLCLTVIGWLSFK
jgi:hypothetical protein